MSDTDKTRDKLLSSIRKTKAGAAAKSEEPGQAKATSRIAKPAAADTPQAAKPATPRSGQRKPRRPAEQPGSDDPYQKGRRVWPD